MSRLVRSRFNGTPPSPPALLLPYTVSLHKPTQLSARAESRQRREQRIYIDAFYVSVWSGCQCTAKFKIREREERASCGLKSGRGRPSPLSNRGQESKRIESPLKCTGATGSNLWRLYAPRCCVAVPQIFLTRIISFGLPRRRWSCE